METELKDMFYEAEKVRMLAQLQASYTAKLPNLYDEQFELSYWVGYAKGERNAINGPELSSDDGLVPTCSTEPAELAREEALVLLVPTEEGTSDAATPSGEEARVLLVPTREGTSEATTVVISEPVIIIL